MEVYEIYENVPGKNKSILIDTIYLNEYSYYDYVIKLHKYMETKTWKILPQYSIKVRDANETERVLYGSK